MAGRCSAGGGPTRGGWLRSGACWPASEAVNAKTNAQKKERFINTCQGGALLLRFDRELDAFIERQVLRGRREGPADLGERENKRTEEGTFHKHLSGRSATSEVRP